MLIDAPLVELDLLLVGGLTVDRFADGSTAPGGSVLHAARAGARAAWRIGAVVLAGDEPEAREGLRELGRLTTGIHVERGGPGSQSIGFEQVETPAGRRMTFLGSGGLLVCPPRAFRPAAVLYAPVADELGPGLGGQHYNGTRRGAILQGWLRRLEPGATVEPLPLSSLPRALVGSLRAFDLLVASREDLLAEASEPSDQLKAMRAVFGVQPTLIVTDGAEGCWIEEGSGVQHLPVPHRVEGVSSVGAGDVFAAFALLALGLPGATAREAAVAGMTAVIEMLAARGR